MAKNEVAKVASSAVAVIDFGSEQETGFEHTDSSDYAIPFLRVLQSLSPQCKKSDPGYIKGAEEGDFFNTVTEKLYKGDDGVTIVPVHYIHKYNAWAQDRSGIRGTYTPIQAASINTTQNERFQEITDDGNILTDTREFYIIIVNADGSAEPALLSLSGTQLKKAKKWMAMMQSIRIQGRVAPMFSQMYKLTPQAESNDKGSWSGIKVEHIGSITSVEVYEAAKAFREMVRSGAAKVALTDGEIEPF